VRGRTTTRVNLRLPDELYHRIQNKAQQKNLTAYDWIKRLIEKELGIRPRI